MRPILRKRGPDLRRSCCYRARFAFFASIRMLTPESAARIARQWDDDIVPQLVDYIRIPAKSPHFDPAWEANGHIEKRDPARRSVGARAAGARVARSRSSACRAARRCCCSRCLRRAWRAASARCCCTVISTSSRRWSAGATASGPWKPVIEDGKLYGRGGADDGYAVFAALAAIGALQAQGVPHARCVGMIETCEESGSYDLPAYLEALAARMGRVDFVVGLDSGCGDYERLWVTTSLRGLAAGTLTVDVLTEGVHSGDASGIVPSSFRIARQLLDRLEDASTGCILPVGCSTCRFRRSAPSRRTRRPRSWATRHPQVSVRGRHGSDGSAITRKRCSIAPGGLRCRSSAPTACRPSRTPATCCGRAPRSSCRCACRPPSTATKATHDAASACSRPIRPTAPR